MEFSLSEAVFTVKVDLAAITALKSEDRVDFVYTDFWRLNPKLREVCIEKLKKVHADMIVRGC
jgi:hypothetical protein